MAGVLWACVHVRQSPLRTCAGSGDAKHEAACPQAPVSSETRTADKRTATAYPPRIPRPHRPESAVQSADTPRGKGGNFIIIKIWKNEV